jgi:hypothetical protein
MFFTEGREIVTTVVAPDPTKGEGQQAVPPQGNDATCGFGSG